jgi:penicillin-binding protein 1C
MFIQRNKIIVVLLGFVLAAHILLLLVPHTSFNSDYSEILIDKNGYLLSASIAEDGQWRFPPINTIPNKYEQALITFEDNRFYYHPGVDPLAIARALSSNIKAGRVKSGASTITMQVIRLSRRGSARTVGEKVLEALLALHLELKLSKMEILSLYASHAPSGGNVVGLEAASWRYFGREPDRLTWAESAMLAVLPNSPALIHPGRNRQDLLEKRNALLYRMYEKGIFDTLTYELSVAEILPPEPHPMPMHAPHLLARLKSETDTKNISRFESTLDKNLQVRVNQILNTHYQYNQENLINNASAVIFDVHTGETMAYVGNLINMNLTENGNFVDIVMAPRSTGSILKPFLYAGMLQGGDILPGQLVPDIPTRLGGFAPQNFNRKYQGAVPAWKALARSLNVPAVRMLQSYGVDRFYHLLQKLGMSTLFRHADDYGLSLILGGAEGTLWELTSIYATMANQLQLGSGRSDDEVFNISYLKKEKNSSDGVDENYPLDAGTIWLVFEAMTKVVRPGAENAWRNYVSSSKIAWKTGTSYGHRDAWAIGVTPDYAVGVWVGNADGEGRPGLTGLQVAAPVLFDIFNFFEKGRWFDPPEMYLDNVLVCSKSGFRKGPNCEQSKMTQSTRSENTRVCPYCKNIHLDKEQKFQVSSDCEPIDNIYTRNWFVLPPAMEWFYLKNHSDYKPLPRYKSGCFE